MLCRDLLIELTVRLGRLETH